MADDGLATKAPESDQQPTTTTSEAFNKDGSTEAPPDTHAHDACTTSANLPSSLANVKPAGELTTINDVECYITKPANYPHNPSKLLLFLTNGTGPRSLNNQLQADAFANSAARAEEDASDGTNYVVVMPDQFAGDPAPNTGPPAETTPDTVTSPTILERVKLGAAETAKSFRIDMWLARHTPERILPRVRSALEGAREQFADAVANGGGVYGVGYCFGAKYAMLLCSRDPETVAMGRVPNDLGGDSTGGGMHGEAAEGESGQTGKSAVDEDAQEDKDIEAEAAVSTQQPPLKAASIAHATSITPVDISSIISPISMACVSKDQLFPDEVREQGRARLELAGVDHEIRVFEGMPHGFAVLGEYGDEGEKGKIGEMQKEAFGMMKGWLDSH
ncbi:MAG: hypothetical protein M1831_001211 [Alyxoria varia]|nr:MAG: hypothetical protein M1831_001211 [Alyxoria varia]